MRKPDYTKHDNIDSYLPMSQEQADIIRYVQKNRSRHHFSKFVILQGETLLWNLNLANPSMANSRNLKSTYSQILTIFVMMAYPIEFKNRKFANI